MNNEAELRAYLREVEHAYQAGNATEHTYRPYLKTLLERLATGITATNEPKRVACGAPDYAITRKDPSGPRTIGYVEAKDIGVSLVETLRTNQLKRYMDSLDNLVLTDYLEFRWFVRRDGQMIHQMTARIASVGVGRKLVWEGDGAARVADMLVAMLGQKAPDINSPDELAQRMARMAHMLANVALDTLRSEGKEGGEQVRIAREELADLFKTFKETLIPDLTDEDFADMFAQTLAYGLFAARYNHTGPQNFTRRDAAREIPRSNPFLRRLFATIENPDLEDAPYVGFIDDLAQLLANTDMGAVLRGFGKRTRTEDPIVHFYEPFLQAYNPKVRDLRGVYYTPEPVVSYIVRSVDALLKRDFGLPGGLASGSTSSEQSVVLLDPACGTGTFISSAINLIRERFRASENIGAWPDYVRERLLPRLFGFELLMAPYAMAHLRLGMQIAGLDLPDSERAQWAFQAGDQDRLGVYLTNTLEQAAKQSEHIFRGQFITDEANAAARLKRDSPVMVVVGNPPYRGQSANNGVWIKALLHGEDLTNNQGERPLDRGKGRKTANYFEVDGEPLHERNPKWVNNDYIKFIRFAQWRIERTGYGVLGFITPHGYLSDPTARGVRRSLMQAFDEIYVIDLHGSVARNEASPAGGKEQNVFDIEQGVAISLFVRRRGAATGIRNATVHHAQIWGERTSKYGWLAAHDVETTDWVEVVPSEPFYSFAPEDEAIRVEYNRGVSISDIFTVKNIGVITSRDRFAIAFNAEALVDRVRKLRSPVTTEAVVEQYALRDTRETPLTESIKVLRTVPFEDIDRYIKPILYRPFDVRYIYYHEALIRWPVKQLMHHMLAGPNLGLVSARSNKSPDQDQFTCTRFMTETKCGESTTQSYLYPLYLYPDKSTIRKGLWAEELPSAAPGGARANLDREFVSDFSRRLGLTWVAYGKGDRVSTFGPEDVFSYLYAIFHSPTYRERYADFLRRDYPRVPLTCDAALFRALCTLGDRLVGDHLLEHPLPSIVRYPVGGNHMVEALRYIEPSPDTGHGGRVYINREQYFEGIPPKIWEFQVGGYQVAEKWLKDRKGRTLTYNDIEHYENVIAALSDTATVMERIDEVIEEHGGWPLAGATS